MSNPIRRPQPKLRHPSSSPPVLVVVKHKHRQANTETQTRGDIQPLPQPAHDVVVSSTQTTKTQPPFNDSPMTETHVYLGGQNESNGSFNGSGTLILASSDNFSEPTSPRSHGVRNLGQFTAVYVEPNGQNHGTGEEPYVMSADLIGRIKQVMVDEAKHMLYTLGPKETVPRGLELLLDTGHFFIQPGVTYDFTEAFLHLKNKYDIIDSHGERLFYAGELWNLWSSPNSNWCTGMQKYLVKLLNSYGQEVLSIHGNSGIARLKYNDLPLGTVEMIPECCYRTEKFCIKDERGSQLYKLVHEIGSQSLYEYEIFDKNDNKVGRVSKTWIGLETIDNVYDEDFDTSLAYTYGIEFPIEISVKEKTLLLTALFSLYFKYVGDTGMEVRNEKLAWCTVITCCLIVLLLIIGFSFLAAYAFRH